MQSFKKWPLIYGAALGAGIVLLKIAEHEYYTNNLTLEAVIGLIAIIFIFLGVWIGNVFNKERLPEESVLMPIAGQQQLLPVEYKMDISPREYEVLQLMALGQSNQEIADNLYISLSTVKTHTTNIYAKLDVRRRTQAVQKAKELKILQ